MKLDRIQRWAPASLNRYLLHFEVAIEQAVRQFSSSLPAGSRVLDAGAGESKYIGFFGRHNYYGVDLAVGDSGWDYSKLHVIADLSALPFSAEHFDACLNIVTLEHVQDPGSVLQEIARTLKPGGSLLLIVPHEWEVHQAPHDYFRFTRYGVNYLLEKAAFSEIAVLPVGGFFRLLSRRLLNGLQFFPALLLPVAALFLAPPALVLPVFDFLDRERNFTLGYICTAKKRS
jgi:SAM-dependent methyltransferase